MPKSSPPRPRRILVNGVSGSGKTTLAARPMLLERCEVIVWLDLPRWRSMAHLGQRTVRRRLQREELWNGNVEQPLWRVLADPDHILRYAWRSWPKVAQRIEWAQRERPDLPVVRLRSPDEVEAWLATLRSSGRPAPPR